MVAHSPLLNIDDLLGPQSRGAEPVACADALPQDRVIAADAQIATMRGLVAAGDLDAGDRVLTRDSGYVAVAAVRMTTRAVVREHLLIDTRFAALFGSREVLVADGAVVASGRGVILTLDTAELVLADGDWVRGACASGRVARPALSGREADVALRMAGLAPQLRASAAAS
jgi:hypothetical protein